MAVVLISVLFCGRNFADRCNDAQYVFLRSKEEPHHKGVPVGSLMRLKQ